MRPVTFGNNQQPACVFVDAMHDAGAFFAAHTGQTVSAVMQERIDQGALG